MKNRIRTLLIALLSAVFIVGVSAQEKPITANGVTMPAWMAKCIILRSESAFFGKRTVGQIFSSPKESTKLKTLKVRDKNISLAYEMTGKDNAVVLKLSVELVCAKYGDAGTCYTSSVTFDSPLTFQHTTASCSSPDEAYSYGKCLGLLSEAAKLMFIDEVEIARDKERNAKAEQEKATQLAAQKKT